MFLVVSEGGVLLRSVLCRMFSWIGEWPEKEEVCFCGGCKLVMVYI